MDKQHYMNQLPCNCDIKNHLYVKRLHSNDSLHVYFFCSNCGKQKAVSKNGFNLEIMKWYDDIIPIMEKIHHDLNESNNEFITYAQYNDYLISEEWQVKRIDCLDRYDYKCQICFKTATDVHHLNYAHVFNEFDFELIPLCRKCHQNYYHKRKILQTTTA